MTVDGRTLPAVFEDLQRHAKGLVEKPTHDLPYMLMPLESLNRLIISVLYRWYILSQFSLILSVKDFVEISELMDMARNNGAMCHTMDHLMLLGIFSKY